MLVGPSAAAMMAVEAASFKSKPNATAKTSVMKMPNWAAAPKRNILGLLSKGPKSIMAPMPIKRSSGNSSLAIPALKSVSMASVWTKGRFTRMEPKPMGSSSVGSICFLMAHQISAQPISSMTPCCQV